MKNKHINYGWSPSVLDGTEHIAQYENMELPSSFSYRAVIPGVLNQGATSTCVPHAVSSLLDWQDSLKVGNPASYGMSIYNIYDRRDNEGEGMSFKCAMNTLKKIGAVTTEEYKRQDFSHAVKIREYAMIKNVYALKCSVMMNGPCMIATLVRNDNSNYYWKGTKNYGGHAVSCVGWDESGILIRNSWGKQFGDEGYVHMDYEDFNCVLEAWTAMF